jgi:hypothetical protein
MDTFSAVAMGMVYRYREPMVFDWDKAARLIKEHKPEVASAGLHNDWEYTGGDICLDGQPVMEPGTYLASTWATPELDLDGEVFECYRKQREVPDWDAKTVWPESALAILRGE